MADELTTGKQRAYYAIGLGVLVITIIVLMAILVIGDGIKEATPLVLTLLGIGVGLIPIIWGGLELNDISKREDARQEGVENDNASKFQ